MFYIVQITCINLAWILQQLQFGRFFDIILFRVPYQIILFTVVHSDNAFNRKLYALNHKWWCHNETTVDVDFCIYLYYTWIFSNQYTEKMEGSERDRINLYYEKVVCEDIF
jgi:hypothetical protein